MQGNSALEETEYSTKVQTKIHANMSQNGLNTG